MQTRIRKTILRESRKSVHDSVYEESLRGNAEIIANEACPVQRSDSRGRMQRYAPLHDHAHWTGRGGTIVWLCDRSLRVRAPFLRDEVSRHSLSYPEP